MSAPGLPLVLVHGGVHGAWCWAPLLGHLTTPALAVDLPPKVVRGDPFAEATTELAATRLSDFAASVRADVAAADFQRFVLVGHSMGGLTIAEVARQVPEQVAALVFVSCLVPPEGGTSLDALPADLRDRHAERTPDPPELPTLRLDDATIRRMFCNDMDDEQTGFVLAHCGTEASGVLTEHVTRRGIPPTLPKTYVRLRRDQSLTPTDQDQQIANLRASPGGEVDEIELDTGHDVMISAPQLLAPLLDRLAAGPVTHAVRLTGDAGHS